MVLTGLHRLPGELHRRTIVGLTQYSTKAHLARATLEAMCFQSREVSFNVKLDFLETPTRQVRQ